VPRHLAKTRNFSGAVNLVQQRSPFGTVTGSEDFAYFLEHRPGCFVYLA
jgi:metal-dependent amidase/aminoacylase/carboxypeptidase family protein